MADLSFALAGTFTSRSIRVKPFPYTFDTRDFEGSAQFLHQRAWTPGPGTLVPPGWGHGVRLEGAS